MITTARPTRRQVWGIGLALAVPLTLSSLACTRAWAEEGSASMKQHLDHGARTVELPSAPALPGMPVMEDLQSLLHWTRERNRPYLPPRAEELGRFSAAATALFQEVRESRCNRCRDRRPRRRRSGDRARRRGRCRPSSRTSSGRRGRRARARRGCSACRSRDPSRWCSRRDRRCTHRCLPRRRPRGRGRADPAGTSASTT